MMWNKNYARGDKDGLTVLVGWFGYHFIYPFFLMDADDWHLLLTVVLMCAVCGCGFGAAFQQSAPWTITTFGVAFTIGHLSGRLLLSY